LDFQVGAKKAATTFAVTTKVQSTLHSRYLLKNLFSYALLYREGQF